MKMIKNRRWILLAIGGVLAIGFFLNSSWRQDLGTCCDNARVAFQPVDPKLIQYHERESIVPTVGTISALAVSTAGKIYIGGANAIERVGGEKYLLPGASMCLAVDDSGTIFAGMRTHVLVIKGGKITEWPSLGEKARLTSIAVDEWYVYVADAGNRRIWRYKKGGSEPLEIGKKNWANAVRGFNVSSPFFDVAISPADGSIWAVNPGYHALENYRPDGMPLSSWEAPSMTIQGFSGCCNPAHFALMPDGGFVTTEKGLPRVKIHNRDGSLRCVVAASDQFDADVMGLDVAVGSDGTIFVLDPARNRVRVFEANP